MTQSALIRKSVIFSTAAALNFTYRGVRSKWARDEHADYGLLIAVNSNFIRIPERAYIIIITIVVTDLKEERK